MKTLNCKPTLEVLEDRLVPTNGPGGIQPMESMSLSFRAPGPAMTLITNTAMLQPGHDSVVALEYLVLGTFQRPSEGVLSTGLGHTHRLLMGDGNVRHAAMLAGSAEYFQTSTGPTAPDLSAGSGGRFEGKLLSHRPIEIQARFYNGAGPDSDASRLELEPPSVLIGLLIP